jgi:hypothetical protein
MKERQTEPETRVSVRLSEDEYALLPPAKTLSHALRRAIVEASAAREIDNRLSQLGEQIARISTQLGAVRDAGGHPQSDDADSGRLARLELFIVQLAEAQARFLEQYCALQSTVETRLALATAGDAALDDTARRERHDALLRRLFDSFDLQVQEMAAQVLATDRASPAPPPQTDIGPARPASQAAE